MIHRCTGVLVATLFLFAATSACAEDQFFDSNGVKIHYTIQGRGEPVVLIHGFGINGQFQWVVPGIVKALAADYQVILPDCRGHGQSGKPHDPKQYDTEVVEDVIRLLDHLKIKKAHIVGYSMGGFITLKLASMHPERVLSATTGGAGWGRKEEVDFLDEIADSLEKGKGITPLIIRLTPKSQPKPTEEHLKTVNTVIASINDTKALAAALRGMKNLWLSEEQLKKITVPTLAIIGEIDPLKEGVDALQGRMPNLKVVVIKRGDHMNAFVAPEFAQSLKDFLAEHGTKGKDKQVETRTPVGASRR
jgi:pimeloyl-ACP methyl ester carboxylesterase